MVIESFYKKYVKEAGLKEGEFKGKVNDLKIEKTLSKKY